MKLDIKENLAMPHYLIMDNEKASEVGDNSPFGSFAAANNIEHVI